MSEVTREQALAFRLAGQHLHRRLGAGHAAEAAAATGLQDLPPGSALAALAARVDDAGPDAAAVPALALVPSVRGAARLVPVADLEVFTTALLPPDEKAARGLIGSATRSLDKYGIAALDAMERVTAAVRDALSDGPLARDDFHQALRDRLDDELLPWCSSCRSHHVAPALWRSAGLHGALAIMPGGGRGATFVAAPPAPAFDGDPGAELVRRFLRAYGPATPDELADWAGISGPHARRLWRRVEPELADAPLDGRDTEILEADATRLAGPPASDGGARLLPPSDPYLDQRDRETLLPDPELRKRVRRPAGNPGVVLVAGALAGLWSAKRATGGVLRVEVEALGNEAAQAGDALEEEAARLGRVRGAAEATVAFV